MKQYFMIETKKGVSKAILLRFLRIFMAKNLIRIEQLEGRPHTVASLEKFINYNEKRS